MEWLALLALAFCAATTVVHLLTIGFTAYRVTRNRTAPGSAGQPAISVLRPMRGIDQYDEETLKSGFLLTYPRFELILCVEDRDDAAVPVARRLIAEHPNIDATLLIAPDKTTANPKLNNLIKGWEAAKYDWATMSDCNVLMPPDYLQQLLSAWREDTGLVCSPPVADRPEGWGAALECAFLNTFQARWQYAADTVGLGFAQGKSMLWRRDILEEAGGIKRLGAEIAEDAAATKVVRAKGLRVRLVDRPFVQPLGRRTIAQVWGRQLRWARLRRVTFPAFFIPELFAGSVFPIAAGVAAAGLLNISGIATFAVLCALWFGAEYALARVARWPSGWKIVIGFAIRDLILPALWLWAWLGNSFVWRGNEMDVKEPAPVTLKDA
jgi:ceramide glucosyltransferase